MQSLLRISKSVMTSSPKSLLPISAAPHVPIPKNGVDHRNKIVLAPMVRSGELPSRLLALHYGADLVWGPETVDKAMIGTTRRVNPRTSCIEWTRFSSNGGRAQEKVGLQKESVIYRVDPQREKGRLVYQIGTSDPDLAVQNRCQRRMPEAFFYIWRHGCSIATDSRKASWDSGSTC
jgi:tRNA-dihydrouridine synthase 2